jgi:hypothetical protein
MQKVTNSYLYLMRKLGTAVCKLILDWYEVTRFIPADIQFPL